MRIKPYDRMTCFRVFLCGSKYCSKVVELLKEPLVMLSKGLGTYNSPIVIESEVEDSPVEVVLFHHSIPVFHSSIPFHHSIPLIPDTLYIYSQT